MSIRLKRGLYVCSANCAVVEILNTAAEGSTNWTTVIAGYTDIIRARLLITYRNFYAVSKIKNLI